MRCRTFSAHFIDVVRLCPTSFDFVTDGRDSPVSKSLEIAPSVNSKPPFTGIFHFLAVHWLVVSRDEFFNLLADFEWNTEKREEDVAHVDSIYLRVGNSELASSHWPSIWNANVDVDDAESKETNNKTVTSESSDVCPPVTSQFPQIIDTLPLLGNPFPILNAQIPLLFKCQPSESSAPVRKIPTSEKDDLLVLKSSIDDFDDPPPVTDLNALLVNSSPITKCRPND